MNRAVQFTCRSYVSFAYRLPGGPALNFVRLDPDGNTDPLDVRMGEPVAVTLVALNPSCLKHQFLATGYSALAPSILSDVGS
jgi:hypothetical protein